MDETDNAPIEISNYTPPFMRWVLGVFGIGLILLPLHELGRGLWPINIFTPFIALMLAVCIPMGLFLMAGVIWGPDTRWVIVDGKLSIIYQRFGKVLSVDHPYTDFQSSTIETSDSDSGPDTYYINLRLTPEAESKRPLNEFAFLPVWLIGPILMVRNQMMGKSSGLTSPHFKDHADAEAALLRLMTS